MKQINFNNYRDNFTENDIDQIMQIIGARCRENTLRRLRSMLTYGLKAIPYYGILERLMFENGQWHYCAGQSYPDEIRIVRNIIKGGE